MLITPSEWSEPAVLFTGAWMRMLRGPVFEAKDAETTPGAWLVTSGRVRGY